jgi:DNA repair exonuclease SbcCD nuclease subunit
MQRPLDQIKALADNYKAPILFAGDLFDRWKASHEMVNWALRNVPTMYSVAGNHDLPHHRYDDINKSAYWTMVEAGRIIDLQPGKPHPVNDHLTVYGFPWSSKVVPPSKPLTGRTVALVHAYCWVKKAGYPGASAESRAGSWAAKLEGYDYAVFGDNHKPFVFEQGGVQLVNCGSLMRLKSDQRTHRPRAYLLWTDGDVTAEYLDAKDDVMLPERQAEEDEAVQAIDAADVLREVGALKAARIDYLDAVKRLMDRIGVKEGTREKVMKSLEAK